LNVLRSLHGLYTKNRALAAGFVTLALIAAGTVTIFAQQGAMSPNQDESDGVSAGGKWMVFRHEDKMTAAKKVRFELTANNFLRENPDSKPRVELVCTNGKYEYSDFNPGTRLSHPDYPAFWTGQPKMEVMVRIDGYHDHKGWSWVRDRFLAMDKGTIRGVLNAQVFNIEARTRNGGPEIAEFSPGGIDLGLVKQSCDLTPHKP
jgi:hypothetical protein